MTSADSQTTADSANADAASYAPYAQLAKMLVPSSGCIAVYDSDGELIWCSDGYERPDLRELIEELKARPSRAGANQGTVRQTSSGVTAFVSELVNEAREPLGFVTVELGGERAGGNTMAASLLRPVLECLASRISLEQSLPPVTATIVSSDVDFLMGVNEVDTVGPRALDMLMKQCVANLGCASAAFLLPDQNITITAHRHAPPAEAGRNFLDRTQKHLLAWAQLNNRPMVVNRVGDRPDTPPYKILSCPIRDAQQRVTGLMALFRAADEPNFELRDVHMLEFLSRKAVSIVNERHDRLTGLMNRLAFEQQLQELLERRSEAAPGALLYLDIDRLQAVNDAFGLLAGDEVIQRLAELILGAIGPDDLACRIAGDRFAIYLVGRGESDAEHLAQKLRDAMSRLGYMQGGNAVPVYISVGLASEESGINDGRHLLALAELACKQARNAGGNRLSAYTPAAGVSPRRERELIAAASIQHALQGNEFRLLGQPIIALGTESRPVAGYEALVRMLDATGTLVSPDRFMNAARRYGLAPAVDKWVFAALVRDLKDRAGLAEELELGIGINVSEQSLVSRDYRDFVLAELDKTALPGALFRFELSEAAAVRNVARAESFIAAIRDAGCSTALDGFGSGLTSLTHLRRLHVDLLKLDGELIRGMLDDKHVESLVLGLAKAAHSLGLKTVAEHVENQALAEKARSLGVDYAQGFCYGKPKRLLRLIAQSNPATDHVRAGQL